MRPEHPREQTAINVDDLTSRVGIAADLGDDELLCAAAAGTEACTSSSTAAQRSVAPLSCDEIVALVDRWVTRTVSNDRR